MIHFIVKDVMFYQKSTAKEKDCAEKIEYQRVFEQDQLIPFHKELLFISMKLKHYFHSFDIFAHSS